MINQVKVLNAELAHAAGGLDVDGRHADGGADWSH